MNLDVEPARRCPKHEDEAAPFPCGSCIEAREFHADWQRQVGRVASENRSRNAQENARLTASEITRCRLCDERGYTPSGALCWHDPTTAERAKHGAAACRTAMAEARTAHQETEQ